MHQTVYLLQEREFIKTNESIFKIGRTKREISKRMKGYPKGSKLLCIRNVMDSQYIEKQIKKEFIKKFKQRKDIGTEYFEGNELNIINLFNKIISKNNKKIHDYADELACVDLREHFDESFDEFDGDPNCGHCGGSGECYYSDDCYGHCFWCLGWSDDKNSNDDNESSNDESSNDESSNDNDDKNVIVKVFSSYEDTKSNCSICQEKDCDYFLNTATNVNINKSLTFFFCVNHLPDDDSGNKDCFLEYKNLLHKVTAFGKL